MSVKDAQKIRERIKAALIHEQGLSEKDATDVAFHMTDWLDDHEELSAFFERPQDYDDEAVVKLLIGYLAHVPWHVNEAARLVMGDDE